MGGLETLTAMRGESDVPEIGAVSGYLLRLIRGSIGSRQVDLAEQVGVDISTVQGWETGRRSLTSLRASDMVRLRHRLTALGAPATATSLLSEAVEADSILTVAAQAGGSPLSLAASPLATTVHRRTLVSLLTWPFTGIAPRQVRGLPAPPSRGPTADRPQLGRAVQDRFFDHALVSADSAAGTDATLLRRQAAYLLGFDQRAASADWLAREHRRTMALPMGSRDIPATILSRSASLALARQGDPEPVQLYIQSTIDNETYALANLTYWAYWLGEVPEVFTSDGDMVEQAAASWSGMRLMDHLLGHLRDPRNAEINVHSLWSLVLARPGLLERDVDLRRRADTSVEEALSTGLSGHARRELANLQCAIQLAGR